LWLTEVNTSTNHHSQRKAIKWTKKPKITEPTKKVVQKNLRKAQQHLKTTIKNAPKNRREFLQAKITELEMTGDKKGARVRRRIIGAEENSRMWSRLSQIQGKANKGGVTYVLEPTAYDQDGKPTEWEPTLHKHKDPHSLCPH
jgi:hypothetical protein